MLTKKKLRENLQKLIEPHSSLDADVNERRFAIVLSVLMLLSLALYFVPMTIRAIVQRCPLVEILFFASGIVVSGIAYLFARSPYPRRGARLILLYLNLLPFLNIMLHPARYGGENAIHALVWTIPVVMMTLILLPPTQVKYVVIMQSALYLLMPALLPQLSYRQVSTIVWVMLVTGGVVSISAFLQKRYLQQTEEEAVRNKVNAARYREIFLNSPTPLWEADFSQIKHRLDSLAEEYGADLMDYVLRNPNAMVGAASSIVLLDANQAALELYEADNIDVLKRSLHIIVDERGLIDLRDGVIGLWLGQPRIPIKTVHTTLKGNKRNVVVRFSVRSGDEDTWDRVIFSVTDVTRERVADASMRKLASAVEASASSIVITNLDGNIEYVNPAFSWVTGYAKEEVLGENPRILKSGLHSLDFYKKMWETLARGDIWRGELTNKRKNGELYWEYASISPVKDDDGSLVGFVAVKDDITKMKEAERELRNLSNAAEQIASGIVITDLDGFIEYVNPAFSKITGYTRDEVVGKNVSLLRSGEHDDEFYYRHEEVISRGDTWRGEIINRRKDGTLYWEYQVMSPVKNERGDVVRYVSVKDDITRRKELEQALALAHEEALAASDMKTQLLANVSHDMRTPLGAIIGYTEMLQTGVFGSLNDKQADATRAIASSSQRLLDFVNDLLNQAQIDTGKIVLNETLFAPHQLFDNLGGEISLARTQNLTVETDIADDMPEEIYGDPYWLGQILHNLLSNAIKFTPRGGKISVNLYQAEGDKWALRVADTGKGIPQEAQDYIFESFRQVDGSPSRQEHTGSGLGLSIVQHLVELMRGEILLESEVDKGSVFTVLLPLKTTGD